MIRFILALLLVAGAGRSGAADPTATPKDPAPAAQSANPPAVTDTAEKETPAAAPAEAPAAPDAAARKSAESSSIDKASTGANAGKRVAAFWFILP